MKGSIDKAKNDGIIKSVDDIKLTNEKKKVFKEGIAYDAFDDIEQGIFAVKQVGKLDDKKILTIGNPPFGKPKPKFRTRKFRS